MKAKSMCELDKQQNSQRDIESKISIQNMFMDTISVMTENPKGHIEDAKKLFTFEDVLTTTHPLARLLRKILSDHDVTAIEFEEKHREYAEAAGFLSAQVGYNRNNIKKGMNKPRITWPMLETVVLVILGFTLEDLIIKLRHPTTGQIHQYSLQGIIEEACAIYGDATPVIEHSGDGICIPIQTPTQES